MTLQNIIRSYLYDQYSDDDDLQAFVDAQNELTQDFLDWFNSINLPIYTQSQINGALLDWVAEGLYGLLRPSLPIGHATSVGGFNTYALNTTAFNAHKVVAVVVPGGIGQFSIGVTPIGGSTNPNYYATSDDTFKRILTWLFYKGDGKVFSIRWLKRRIMRFLLGENGLAPNVDQTYQVSVTFGVGNQVNIRIVLITRRLTGGALLNRFALNGMAFNAVRTVATQYAPLPGADTVLAAIESGALELPFQYDYVVINS